MCEFCGVSGPCIVCGRTGDDEADIGQRIRQAERELATAEIMARACRERLERLRKLAGRRPGDGSDQPALFEAASQPSIF